MQAFENCLYYICIADFIMCHCKCLNLAAEMGMRAPCLDVL